MVRILVTNDDGIHSAGLWALAEALSEAGAVFVVAPDRDQSGVGTSMTLLDVVRTEKVQSPVHRVEAHSIQGTPADSVILAVGSLYEEPFDLIFSGINQGANVGMDVLVSGTVGGAMQGYVRGIPSVAVSTVYQPGRPIDYDSAGLVSVAVARYLERNPPEVPLLLNVNLPDADLSEVKDVEITLPGPRAFRESVEREQVGRRSHYWIKHSMPSNLASNLPQEGTDVRAIWENRVSISPLDLVLTTETQPQFLEALARDVRKAFGFRI